MKTNINGNFIANGIVIKNCDALRYACYSAFPRAEFSHPDENLSIEQLRNKVYGGGSLWGNEDAHQTFY